MITFVYCCICLLIVCCHTTRTESEEFYSNDSPLTLPQVESLRPKPGEDVVMKCNKNTENITWEFKRCQPGNLCDNKSMYKLDYSEGEWKKLDFNQKRRKLKIKNATEESIGFYRCLYNNSIIKIYILDLAATRYSGPLPEVVSLKPSSSSPITANTPLAIQCKVTSVPPAEIRWFKECNGLNNCDVEYDGYRYCHLNSSNSVYSLSNNIYLSKLNIHNPHNVDSGTYVCVVINVFGEHHKNITIKIDDVMQSQYENKRNSFSLLFLIPLLLISVPALIWLCFNRRKKKNRQRFSEHQKQLIKPNVDFDIVVNVDDVV